MKEIKLTQGKKALVSDEDYEWLSQWKWRAKKEKNGFVAIRTYKDSNKIHKVYMHRLIMSKVIDNLGERLVDHQDRNNLNNQRGNLRIVSPKKIGEKQSVRTDNTSGHKGVCWDKSKNQWCAYLGHNNKRISLGTYFNKEDAVKARMDAEEKYWTHSEVCV